MTKFDSPHGHANGSKPASRVSSFSCDSCQTKFDLDSHHPIMSRQSSGGNGIRRRNCQSKPSTCQLWIHPSPTAHTHSHICTPIVSQSGANNPRDYSSWGRRVLQEQNDILRADHPTPSISTLPNIPYKYCTSNAGYAACAHLPYPAAVIFNSGLDATAGILMYMSRSSNALL